MATAYLRMKVKGGRLDPDAFGVSVDDLALDCVADFFERDQGGRFIEIVRYYGKGNGLLLSQEELLGATRRLVFSKVNEGLFRLYKENDRSLSNTIRNVKNALRYSDTLFTVVRNNEIWIQPLGPDPASEGLPLIPSELVEGRLLAQSNFRSSLRELMDIFAELLSEQEFYQRQFPLVGLALALRSMMVRTSVPPMEVTAESPDLTQEELRTFVQSSIDRTKASMKPSYVGKGKLSDERFNLYFDCIGEILEAEYVFNNGLDLCYYDILRNRLGTLSQVHYGNHHRVYLEYLAKLTRRNFLESIRNELQAT
jgi:hypothetical protein